MHDRLTVVLPVYNAMPHLRDAVRSILTQTLKDFSLLIINDGSTDGSAAYIDSIRDGRVVSIQQDNRGLGATLNHGIELCRTEYIARMDADDVSLPERLEKQCAFLERRPEVVMLGTQIAFLSGNGVAVAHRGAPLEHAAIVRRLLRGEAGVCHPSVMCRRDAVRKAGNYRIAAAGQDWDFFLRVCEVGKAANTPEVLYHYRVHESSVSTTQYKEIKRGYAYAVCCARCRKAGRREPTFDEFTRRWEQRGLLPRVVDLIQSRALDHYRRGILRLGEGRRARAAGHFLLAGLGMPCRAARRVGGKVIERRRP